MSSDSETEESLSDTLLAFVATNAEWREKMAQKDAATVAFYEQHPALAVLQTWLDGASALHKENLLDHCASGLLRHLAEAWSWAVDVDQISDSYWANCGVAGSSRKEGQLVDTQLQSLLINADSVPNAHRFTAMLLTFMCERNWIPIAAQVPLWHRGNAIYTFIDMILYDIDAKRIVLLEIKTGFDHNYTEPLAEMHAQTDVFVDTHDMRHQQQLCWMLTILRAELPPDTPLVGCVVRVSDADGVREPEWSCAVVEQFFRETYVTRDRAYQRTVPTPTKKKSAKK